MGNEQTCQAQIGKTRQSGKALLETTELIFRPTGGAKSIRIPFAQIKSAKATNGQLHLKTTDADYTFDLGESAEKWAYKILHPKTRIEKLGIKPETSVALLGEFDVDFKKELRAATKNVTENKINSNTDTIFLTADSTKQLATAVTRTKKAVKGATALWIVYPKGQKQITENAVIAAGREAGLKDVKVVGFSPTHTALKFVLPLDKR